MNRSLLLVAFATITLSLGAFSQKDAQNDLRKSYWDFQNIALSYTSKQKNIVINAVIELLKKDFKRKKTILNTHPWGYNINENIIFLITNDPKAKEKIFTMYLANIEQLKVGHINLILRHTEYIEQVTDAAIKKFGKMNKDVLKVIKQYDWSAEEKFTKARKAHEKKVPAKDVFNNLAGELPKDVVETIEFMRGAKKYSDFGIPIPRGILLEGPPGTGKTSIAKAIAAGVNAAFFAASGSQFMTKWQGSGAENLRLLFDKARNAIEEEGYECAVVFIDEIDACGGKRSGQSCGGGKAQDQMVNELLTQMDGFDTLDGLFVIGATNYPDKLDDALTRPGRFDRIIKIGMPNQKNRKAIIKHYALKLPKISSDIDYGKLARKTGGFSGADIKQMINEAAIMAVRGKAKQVTKSHLLISIAKMMKSVKARKKWKGNFGSFTFETNDADSSRDVFNKLAGQLPEDVLEIIDFIKDSERFAALGAQMPKGVLLEGPPGTGKTTIAKCVAQSAGAAFFSVNGSEFVNKYVGQGPANVRKLFDAAREAIESGGCKKAVIFIDELDAVAKQRGSDGNSERDNTVNELLAQMDGFADDSNIFVIAATNNAHLLDKAIKRPGRFDRVIKIGLPNEKSRLAILVHYAKMLPKRAKLIFDKLAKATKGVSGAVLKNLVNEAAVFAARDKKAKRVEQDHFDLALKKMIDAGYIRKQF